MPEEKDQAPEKPPFPAWLRDLCYFGAIIVALTIFAQSGKSDQRSANEKLDRVVSDVARIESRLPNREAEEMRYTNLEKKVDQNKDDLDFAIAKLEKWKDDTTRSLIKKGVID